MEIYNDTNSKEELQPIENNRPQYLKVLCILTFVYTGLNLLFALFGLLQGPLTDGQMEKQQVEYAQQISQLQQIGADMMVHMMHQVQLMVHDMNVHFYTAMLAKIIWTIIGAYAAFQMWNGKKIGFHIYIIYCLLEVAQLYLITSPSNIPLLVIIYELVISTIFVLMYSRNLHWLK